jgi:putative Mn2+ efflux pump MntP
MDILEILLIGVALAMDAFAVTLSNSSAYPHMSFAKRLLLPVTFALFQAAMPVIGYFVGYFVAGFLEQFAGYIALVLLGFIGIKMIWEGTRELRQKGSDANNGSGSGSVSSSPESIRTLSLPILLTQGIATSIDALLVGVSFAALSIDISLAAFVIGSTTFICCAIALLIGKRFGLLLGSRSEIAGGIILILIGLKSAFF